MSSGRQPPIQAGQREQLIRQIKENAGKIVRQTAELQATIHAR